MRGNNCNKCESVGITCFPADVVKPTYDFDGALREPARFIRGVRVNGVRTACLSTETADSCAKYRHSRRVFVDGKSVEDPAAGMKVWWIDFVMGLDKMAKRADLFNWSAGGNPAFRVRWAEGFARTAMNFVVGGELGWGSRALVAGTGLGVLALIAQQNGIDISGIIGSVVERVSASPISVESARTCVTMISQDPVQALNALNMELGQFGQPAVGNFSMTALPDGLFQACTR